MERGQVGLVDEVEELESGSTLGNIGLRAGSIS